MGLTQWSVARALCKWWGRQLRWHRSRLQQLGGLPLAPPLAGVQVYDVTDYIEDHPGGMSICNNAGGEATEVRWLGAGGGGAAA